MSLRNWLIVAGLVLTTPAIAMDAADVEYSADSSMETADGVMKGQIYVAPGMERRESVMDGAKSVMIIRHDKKVVWMLMPDDEAYMEMKLGENGGRKDDLSSYKIDQTTVGPETVNGIEATKSKIVMTGPKGEKLGGFWWATKEGIVVKMDAIAVDKQSKERFKTELTNLKIGKQKRSLFEVPDGYTNMGMGMGGLGNMMGGDDEDEDEKPQEKAKGKKGFGVKDAVNIFK